MGVWDLYTPSGWLQIELGDPNLVEYSPVEISTPSGWAAPRLVDPADADTPIEIYTPQGWKGVAEHVYRLIDSFEDGGITEYYQTSNAWSVVDDPSLATHGTKVLHSSFGQGGKDAMTSGTGLPYYPSRGETFRTNHITLGEANGFGHQFGLNHDGRNIFPDGYSVRANFGDNGDLKLVRQDPGGEQGGEQQLDTTVIDMSGLTGQTLELETEFGNPTITSTLYRENGTIVGRVSASDTTFNGNDFGWISTLDATLADERHNYFDFARTTAVA